LLERARFLQPRDALGARLEREPQRTFDRDPREAEVGRVEDLHVLAAWLACLGERAERPGDLLDVLGRELVALVAEALAHLAEEIDGVEERDLALDLQRLVVR